MKISPTLHTMVHPLHCLDLMTALVMRSVLFAALSLGLCHIARGAQTSLGLQLPQAKRDLTLEFEPPRDIEPAWKDLLNELWRTPLGGMYKHFLFSSIAIDSMPVFTRKFVDHIFSDDSKLMIRISALQLMTKDLYVHGQMDEERQRRVLILEGDVSARRLRSSTFPGKSVGYQAALIFIACLPYGSPLIRDRVGRILDLIAKIIFRQGPAERLATAATNAIFSREVFRGYDIGNALLAFLNIFGPLSTMHFLINEWQTAFNEDFREDHEMLLGLDDFITEQEL